MVENILDVQQLKTSYLTKQGEVQVVKGVDLKVNKGDFLGIIGESGSGKSVLVKSLMRLLNRHGRIMGGKILYKGLDLAILNESEMRRIRGKEIGMIFQDPMTSLNPTMKIGSQVIDSLTTHLGMSKKSAYDETIRLFDLVRLTSSAERLNQYPHELSVGMRQRVMIAIAIACKPKLIIADEPTTSLDVTIQSQIVQLLKSIQKELDTTILLVTHDLGVIAETCNRIAVMYGGLILEEGNVYKLFSTPMHPYTHGLLNSILPPQVDWETTLNPIKGAPLNLKQAYEGCPFAPRCDYAMGICRKHLSELVFLENGVKTRCWLLDERASDNPMKALLRRGL